MLVVSIHPVCKRGEDRRVDSLFGLSTRELNRSISRCTIQSAGDSRGLAGGEKKRALHREKEKSTSQGKKKAVNLVPCL
jgi:hypothetical protein